MRGYPGERRMQRLTGRSLQQVSVGRLLVLVLYLGALALPLLWLRGTPGPEGPPQGDAPERPLQPTATAAPDAAGGAALPGEDLAALRASDDFLEFAEHERAATARFARLAYDNFSPIEGGERVDWTNKDELWDGIAPAIRDEVLLLGPEYRRPLWDDVNARPTTVSMAWNDEDTGGRGHFVEFRATYSSARGPVERYWGVLIATVTGAGVVVGRMEPFEVAEAEFPDMDSAFAYVQEETWAWVQSRPSTR